MIRQVLDELDAVERALETADEQEREALLLRQASLLGRCRNLTPEQQVMLARHPRRPKIMGYIGALFTDFFEQRGDRSCRDDASIVCGLSLIHI